MAIADGYRTHDEGLHHRYRMPDLLTREEMQMYFAGTYGVGIDFRDLTSDEREATQGVGVLPATPQVSDTDLELATLRERLGITSLEKYVGMQRSASPDNLDPVAELDSRTMSREDYAAKYDNPGGQLDTLITNTKTGSKK